MRGEVLDEAEPSISQSLEAAEKMREEDAERYTRLRRAEAGEMQKDNLISTVGLATMGSRTMMSALIGAR